MNNVREKIESFTPQKRALFELLLGETRRFQPEIIPLRHEIKHYPLTSLQEGIWFFCMMNSSNPAYNIHFSARLQGSLNVRALEESLGDIVRRHESLRTIFITIAGSPHQLVRDYTGISLPVIDLTHLQKHQQVAEARRLTDDEAYYRFDLSADSLLRSKILRIDEQEFVFLLTLHHIIIDGWSIGILIRELNALYAYHALGRQSTFPELKFRYSDYAIWQHELLQGKESERQLSFWKQYLKGIPQELALPVDRPRPKVHSYRGDTVCYHLSQPFLMSLQALCCQEEVTLFMLLLAGFMTLLARYSGQTDIVIGVPFANRSSPQTENIIGLFATTLPLRADLSANPAFQRLLKQVRQSTVEAYEHQNVPIMTLINQLQIQRSLNYNPLYQVVMVLQNTAPAQLSLAGVNIVSIDSIDRTAKVDLSLHLAEVNGHLEVTFEFSADLFDNVTIRRMAGHFDRLLASVIADPKQRVSYLPMMTESEELELISAWNDTRVDYPRELCVHNLFDAQADRTPDAIALAFRGHQLTYAQLGRRANQLANYLRSLGVGPEVRVGLSMDCDQEVVVAVLGVLKAGGAYVPLDPTRQLQQLIDMLEDAQPSLLLTQERLRGDLPGQWARIIYIDTNWEEIAQWSGDRPSVELTPHSLAYLTYVPGVTGRPIGVQVQHGGLANLLQDTGRRPELRQSDILLAITQAPLDIVRLEVFLPLVIGARMMSVSSEEASDGLRLWGRMREEGVTALSSSASTLRQLVDAGWHAEGRMKALCDGNALSFHLATEMLSRGSEVWNLYRQAETTVWASMQLVEENVYLGEPVANTNFYVLEEEGRLAASGVPGELYIGGEGVARGYFGRPHLTAGRFVPDGYSKRVGARLYRTADMVRRRANGVLEYVGKADQQAILYDYGYKGTAGFAPSDFPLAKLSQSELDRLSQTLEFMNIEDSK